MARRIPRKGEKGQTVTEMMLVISVIVIGSVGATQFLLDPATSPWAAGFSDFNGTLSKQINRGWIGGHGSPGGPYE